MNKNISSFFEGVNDNFKSVFLKRGSYDTLLTGERNYIMIVLNGNISVGYRAIESQTLSSRRMIVMPLNTEVSVSINVDSRIMLIRFDNEVAESRSDLWDTIVERSKFINDIYILDVRIVVDMFLELLTYCRERNLNVEPIYTYKIRELFLILSASYSEDEMIDFLSPLGSQEIDFREFVMFNFSKVNSVEELSNLAGCSISTFKRRFRQYFKVSVYRWMQIQKSKVILSDIADDKLTLAQIAKKYGFVSSSHFSRFCKIYFDDTPSSMRKKIHEEEKAMRAERKRGLR